MKARKLFFVILGIFCLGVHGNINAQEECNRPCIRTDGSCEPDCLKVTDGAYCPDRCLNACEVFYEEYVVNGQACGWVDLESNYGCVIGTSTTGVDAFSNNGGWDNFLCGNHQCTTFAKRYLGLNDIRGNGGQYYDNLASSSYNFTQYPNGTARSKPQTGDVISFSNGGAGHVAIVDSVDGDELNFIDQNRDDSFFGGAKGKCDLTEADHGDYRTYTVSNCEDLSTYTVLGWARSPDAQTEEVVEEIAAAGPSAQRSATGSERTGSVSELLNSMLHFLNPFNSYQPKYTVRKRLGAGSGTGTEEWFFSGGAVNINYGVANNAYIRRFNNGVIITHPKTGMSVEMYNHHWNVWNGGLVSSYNYAVNDNCGGKTPAQWFSGGIGPKSDFGLPITGSYYVNSTQSWRRDFQRGYMSYKPNTNTMNLNCYPNTTPGWKQDSGWDGLLSVSIARAYERNGAKEKVGWATPDSDTWTQMPSFDGDASVAHSWGRVVVQTFVNNDNEDSAVIANVNHFGMITTAEANGEYVSENRASVVRGGFWEYYKDHDGQYRFGSPLGDEMDTIKDTASGVDVLYGYDPVCDENRNGWVGMIERKACLNGYCGEGNFTSMQRFEFVTLCWDRDYWNEALCDPLYQGGNPHCPEGSGSGTGEPGIGGGGGTLLVNPYEGLRLILHEPVYGTYYAMYTGEEVPGVYDWFTLDNDRYEDANHRAPFLKETAEEINNNTYQQWSADVNGDWLLDIIFLHEQSRRVYVRTGNAIADGSFNATEEWLNLEAVDAVAGGTLNYELLVGDYNGDGQWELTYYDPPRGDWYVALSNGTSFGTPQLWRDAFGEEIGGNTYDVFIGDFNNDWKSDIAKYHQQSHTWQFAFSNGSSFVPQWGTLEWWAHQHAIADINGDGRDDIVAMHDDGRHFIARSNGDSTFTTNGMAEYTFIEGFGTQDYSNMYGVYYTDINEDGFEDIVAWHRTRGAWWVALCFDGWCVDDRDYLWEFGEEINNHRYEVITPYRNPPVRVTPW